MFFNTCVDSNYSYNYNSFSLVRSPVTDSKTAFYVGFSTENFNY